MLNKTIVQGRLTRDPELRTTPSGVSVTSFTVAWSEKYKETETKLFLDCTAWRQTGEFIQKYFQKGQEIVVEGKLSTRKYTDKDGLERSVTELTVDQAHFCGPKQASGDTSNTYQAPADSGDFAEIADDGELPF